jgi:hypothetical protein
LFLKNNSLNLIERNLVVAAVVELGRARALMDGHLLGVFEQTAIEKIDSNAGRAEAVAADLCEKPGFLARRTIMRRASCRVIRLSVSCLRPRPGPRSCRSLPPIVRNSGAFLSAAMPAAAT